MKKIVFIILLMGPFNYPWLTFAAWIVAGASVLVSIVWALLTKEK